MGSSPIRRGIERDYRGVISDNRRWERFVHRPGDIFVCSPPKCGTTWTQTIVATLLFQPSDPPAPVMSLAPWLDARFNPIEDVIANHGEGSFIHVAALQTAGEDYVEMKS